MAAAHNQPNGANGLNGAAAPFPPARYSAVPQTLVVSVAEDQGPYDIEITLDDDIQEDPTELCTLLENENGDKNTWMKVAIAYAKHNKVDVAIEVLTRTVDFFAHGRNEDRLSIYLGLCWLNLMKSREAPRNRPDGIAANADFKTKESYINEANKMITAATQISPSYCPLYLARGVMLLLRASLKGPTNKAERAELYDMAARCFDQSLAATRGKNLMAKLGKARVSYTMGKYAEALKLYQSVLQGSPDLIDPDPRIGIGCCFWQLGFKDDAASAWTRSVELNPKSRVALILLGIYNFHLTAQMPPSDPNFVRLTKKAMTEYIAPSFSQDNRYPLTCATLGNWYVMRKQLDKVEILSRRAIELTDINDIASDGWYQLARKAHQEDDTANARSYYQRSDAARGGDERGYIPAKFGLAQMQILAQDYAGAKFKLEKVLQQQPTLEAQILLGTLYAEEVFAAQASNSKEDISNELRKALKYLEDVTKAWKDPKKKLSPDQSVLLNLARLYEIDHPDKSLKCLEEVEQLELDAIPEEDYPEGIEDEAQLKAALRELLPPQLLNNMGCFHYQSERYAQARELFQFALNACVKAAARDETIDTDALVTSISYNLGRTYESEGTLTDAKVVYNNLLKRHPDYVDAHLRLAFIALRESPNDEGPKAVQKLSQDHKDNLEVRALFGYYLNKSKKRTNNIADDQEQRHYKHTLQGANGANKHNPYALTGLGNIHLTAAREMRGTAEQEKDKRAKAYEKAAEFFDKVLMVDPKNAYAAQGIAIALVEHKKDYQTALKIFSKVKETLKDYSVYMNLGHTYCELKQYDRAIENYETALAKDRAHDPTVLACLGRVWLLRGKTDRKLDAMKTSLEYSRRALEFAPEQIHFKFNVAFVQMQIAQLINGLKDTDRTLADVEAASVGLEEAIISFEEIAQSPNPPFPANDIGQRASMGRNTMRRQLERARESQQKHEEASLIKLERARALLEEENKSKAERERKIAEEQAERKRKIREDQLKLEEQTREAMEKRLDEERRRQELIDDSDMRKTERSSRGKKGVKRRKKNDMSDSETEAGSDANEPRSRRRRTTVSGTEAPSEDERPPRQKKRKLERKKKEPASKYKSSEIVVDSDEEVADAPDDNAGSSPAAAVVESDLDDDEEAAAAPRSRKTARVISEDEDDEDASDAPKAPTQTADTAMDEDDEE